MVCLQQNAFTIYYVILNAFLNIFHTFYCMCGILIGAMVHACIDEGNTDWFRFCNSDCGVLL